MNLHAVRENNEPFVVLYQFDLADPMNTLGLLVAYAEEKVRPVVSDFDTFLVGSTAPMVYWDGNGLTYRTGFRPVSDQCHVGCSTDHVTVSFEFVYIQDSGQKRVRCWWGSGWFMLCLSNSSSGVPNSRPTRTSGSHHVLSNSSSGVPNSRPARTSGSHHVDVWSRL